MRSSLRKVLSLLALPLLASGGEAGAQRRVDVDPGDRVRVTVPSLGMAREVGSVHDVRGDTLVFRPRGGGEPVPLPIPLVARLEVPNGTISVLRGALIGGGVGLLAGYAGAGIIVETAPDCDASDCFTPTVMAALMLPIATTLGGAAGGAVRAARTERWVTVPLSSLGAAGAVTYSSGLPPGTRVRVHAAGPGGRPLVGGWRGRRATRSSCAASGGSARWRSRWPGWGGWRSARDGTAPAPPCAARPSARWRARR